MLKLVVGVGKAVANAVHDLAINVAGFRPILED